MKKSCDNRKVFGVVIVVAALVVVVLALSGTFTGQATQQEKVDVFNMHLEEKLNYIEQKGMPRILAVLDEKRNFNWNYEEYPFQWFDELIMDLHHAGFDYADTIPEIASDEEATARFWSVVNNKLEEEPLPKF